MQMTLHKMQQSMNTNFAKHFPIFEMNDGKVPARQHMTNANAQHNPSKLFQTCLALKLVFIHEILIELIIQ
jgi:hypothetical protein